MESYSELSPQHGHDKPVPPVIYLDLWPISDPMLVVIDAELAAQFTQPPVALPKHAVYRTVVKPLTHGEDDLLSANGDYIKTWRPRFSTGFRSGSLQALMPEIMEGILEFSDALGRCVGPNGHWGMVFPLEEATVTLTFDTIMRSLL